MVRGDCLENKKKNECANPPKRQTCSCEVIVVCKRMCVLIFKWLSFVVTVRPIPFCFVKMTKTNGYLQRNELCVAYLCD